MKPNRGTTQQEDLRVARKVGRTFAGESVGRPLATWLNTGARSTSRVIRILDTYSEIIRCSELLALQSEKPGPTLFFSSDNKVAMSLLKREKRARKQLKKQLSPFVFAPDFAIHQDKARPGEFGLASGLVYRPLRRHTRRVMGRDYPYTDRDAVTAMMALADAWLLDRICRCDCGCGRWLYAQFTSRRWFDSGCHDKGNAAKPEARERRNERRRDNYPHLKRLKWNKEAKKLGINVDQLRRLKLEARAVHIKVAKLVEEKRRAKKL